MAGRAGRAGGSDSSTTGPRGPGTLVPMSGRATVVRTPVDADHGSRLFEIADPDGNHWSAGTWYS